MSSPDSPTIDFFNQRMKRKLEDYEDDDELVYVRTKHDDRNPNSPPATVSTNSFLDQIVHRHPYFQPRASTSGSSDDLIRSSSYHDRIQFFVRMISEYKTLVLHGKPDDRVKVIHEKIQALTGIPLMEQRLIYQGRQLQWEHSLADCMINNDSNLHLVGRMRSTEHPLAWKSVDGLISLIYRLCKGDTKVCSLMVTAKLKEFLDMTPKEDQDIHKEHFVSHLNIFQSLCAPKALVMLYISPHQGNKSCAHESIRSFIDYTRTVLPIPFYSQCGPIVLEFCKLLGRAVSQDDSLYNLCRGSLGSIVEGLSIGRSWRKYDYSVRRNFVISFEDIFPFVTELANKLSEGLNSMNFGSSSTDVRDFAKFLKPIKAAIKQLPDFGGVIPVPMMYNLSCYDDETKLLYMILFDLMKKVRKCLAKIEFDLAMEQKKDTRWDQFLVLLKVVRKIAKLYQGAEEIFWSDMKLFKVSLCYLIVKYGKRGEDYKWLRKRKDYLDFESRRHLAVMLLPEMNEEFEELHEMLIDRSNLLAESFEYIASQDPETMRAGLFMAFKNEEATGPGVLREWFFLVCQEIFNPQNALFVPCPNDRRRFFPNPASKVDPLHLKYFKFVGRVIALALMHKIQVGIDFDRAFVVQLAGADISLEDIKDVDPYLYSSCKQILDMDPAIVDEDVLGLTFVLEIEELGSIKVVELLPKGKNIVVNSKNREQYVELLIKHRFVKSVSKQVTEFAQGFTDIIGKEETRKLFFNILELEDLDGMLHGSESSISVEDWKVHTEYNGYKETDPQIYWFWQIIEEMTEKQRMVLLFFWTSLKHLPVEGFKGLASKLYVYKSNETTDLLPTSHTCFYRICFPAYPSMAVMRERLNIITQDHVGCSFGTW